MKYCHKCGNPMEDDMLFCQKCGTRAVDTPIETTKQSETNINSDDNYSPHTTDNHQPSKDEWNQPVDTGSAKNKPRKMMKIWAIVCFVFAIIYALIAFGLSMLEMGLGMGLFFAILGLMFIVLSKSPKKNAYLFGKSSGITKTTFVVLSIILAFVSVGVSASLTPTPESSSSASSVKQSEQSSSVSSVESSETTTLEDVQKWYENQMPAVGQSLSEYAQSVDGLSNLNVSDSHFYFGGDWSDCYYRFTFTCDINGENHLGEARAFLKYQDDSVNWFSFEVFGNDTLQSVVELYDDSYDTIIEDYYNELVSLYS